WNRPGGMDDSIEIFGAKGQTYADMLMGNALPTYSEVGFGYAVEKASSTKGWTYPVFEEHWNYGFPQEMRHFARCVRGKETPIYDALARRGADLSNVVLVMMDEYLVDGRYAPPAAPWSCHAFVRRHITFKVASVWFPDPNDPAAYDARIADAGGIDLFLLASGASDGHVAFN